ncbi:predicted protein [Brucella abortus]|uniref:Uncharacterized protein n=1 Tax=Brucella abortus (strain 2308) TaxID=359391 RepID=Q2YPX8_BRUA2|nr:conserved hypothetical protein [Brucella abortus 2308]SHO30901.1 predicted protein [Brucella abortus]
MQWAPLLPGSPSLTICPLFLFFITARQSRLRQAPRSFRGRQTPPMSTS